MEFGTATEWLKVSDHVPVFCEFLNNTSENELVKDTWKVVKP